MNSKVVVITGTSSGIGRETAKALLSEGYRVVGVSRRSVVASEFGVDEQQYRHFEYDFEDIEGIAALCKRILETWGTPYGLVNNAAVGGDGALPTMHNVDIERQLRLNLTAPIVFTKYMSRPMLSARMGRIINLSSVVATTGYRGLSVYAATKAGMQGFTRSLARDFGRRGITVNSIAPGFVDTEMSAGLGSENLEKITKRSALGRLSTATEIAAGVVFLLSELGGGITGTTITIDAGNTA